MSKFRLVGGGLLASAALIALPSVASLADDDAYMQMAKEYVAQASAPVTSWTGPTTGPKAQGKKLVIYVSADQKNGGASGVGDGAQEAAKAIGWDFRILDGQGSVPARSSALTQAIALKPDGIILGTIDAAEQAPIIEQAVAAGIKVVGWHAGPGPGKIDAVPGVFTNITTDPNEVAKAAGLYAVVDSGGTAGVILFTDSIYAIATAKTNAEKAAVEGCKGCKVLSIEDTPIGDLSNRMGQLTTSLLAKYGKAWTYSIGVNDLYFDFAAPSLVAAGVDPATGYPRQIAAGDGSVPAFQRIRQKQYQLATVAEPLHLHGWQCIDEMNRAIAGQPPSGYVAHVHLFINSNIDKDGGAQNIFDPGNGYKDEYKKIWGVK
ncbi:MAG: substrate-binding domain-containing protein [Hyphomicrobiales bacterium]|nr:substrate-binding domain-containing protein [Hyphomicrobiales bacterium]MBV9111186.1 substrate-binding domain-containing protein [Hyphomicrobiales bacterium]MBV9520666.1 substrate-binding domain-containing protein [Hyphomicrobiales bacterium]